MARVMSSTRPVLPLARRGGTRSCERLHLLDSRVLVSPALTGAQASRAPGRRERGPFAGGAGRPAGEAGRRRCEGRLGLVGLAAGDGGGGGLGLVRRALLEGLLDALAGRAPAGRAAGGAGRVGGAGRARRVSRAGGARRVSRAGGAR